MKWIVRPDQRGVAFPKKMRVKTRPDRKSGIPESFIQKQIQGTIAVTPSLVAMRVPDALYRLKGSPKLSQAERGLLAEAFSGLPDNDLKLPLPGTPYYLGCLTETKTETGKQTKRQKAYAKSLYVSVVRNLGEFKAVIELFLEYWEWLKKAR